MGDPFPVGFDLMITGPRVYANIAIIGNFQLIAKNSIKCIFVENSGPLPETFLALFIKKKEKLRTLKLPL